MTYYRNGRGTPWKPDVILGFPENRMRVQVLASALGATYADIEVHIFPDGESLVRIPEAAACSGKHVAVFRSLEQPNAKILELVFAASLLGAARDLTLIAPYLCYMRQDKAFNPGEAVSQEVVGKLLAGHYRRFVTVDPHLHRQEALENVFPGRPCLCLTAADSMAEYIRHTLPENTLVLGPDEESAKITGRVATRAGREWTVAQKHRSGDREVEITLPESHTFAGRAIVIVDDIISSGHTIAVLAGKLREAGATRVIACVTHALHDYATGSMMALAGVDTVVSSDCITHATNKFSILETIAWSLKDPHGD